jgi:membrane fusion protein (multidrug efflux system)
MNKRRPGIVPSVVAVALLAAFIIIRIVHSGGAESGEATPNMAVHVGKIARATLHQYITAFGSVEPEPPIPGRLPAHAHIGSAVAGVIAHVDCTEGQKVVKGTRLFRLDSRLADVAYLKAKQALDYAEKNYERQKKLLPVGGTSQKTLLEAESLDDAARSDFADARTNLALLTIEAPLTGTVVNINTEPGEAVDLSSVLATIIDLDRLIVAVNVPRREAAQVKVGQPAEIGAAGAAPGRVVYVGSRVDEKNDTVPVRISIPSGSGYLPGRFLSVRIAAEERADRLVVPVVALTAETLTGDRGAIVLVQGGKAVRKPVKIGLREGGLVEVEATGLGDGQVIVTTDAYAVPDGTQVHIIADEHE